MSQLISRPPHARPPHPRSSSSPGDPSWDQARTAWNLAVDQRPAAVALPETVDDVVAAVDYARELGLRVAVQGTGHGAGAPSTGHCREHPRA